MKRKLLPIALFASSLLLGLVACGEKDPIEPVDPQDDKEEEDLHPYSFPPKSLDVSKKAISLGIGEKTSFITRISPVVAYDAKLLYSSSNEQVATVDENGEITAVAVGNANITVKYEKDASISHVIPVSVFARYGKNSEELNTAMNEMLELQATLPELDEVHCAEYRDYYEFRDNVCTYHTVEYSHTYESKSNAFFLIYGVEDQMKVAGGNFEPLDYSWGIYTDEGFDTHVYHISSGSKTFLIVPTQSYMDGKTRNDAVIKMLSSLFRGADKLYNQAYEDVLSTEDLGEDFKTFRRYVTGGYIGEGVVGYSLTQAGITETISADEESDYGIPANTVVDVSASINIVWKDGYVTTKELTQTFDYELDGKPMKKEWRIYDTYETEGFEIPYPVESEYAKVDTLYDL